MESLRFSTFLWSVAEELWRDSNKLLPRDSQDRSPILLVHGKQLGNAALEDARSRNWGIVLAGRMIRRREHREENLSFDNYLIQTE
jgi:hypothetical protein